MMQVVLKAKDVTKAYKRQGNPALNRVSFEAKEGELLGIMGASGVRKDYTAECTVYHRQA